MHSVYDTLTQTYQLIEHLPRPYPSEVNIILSMFVSPEHIEAFEDDSLYLRFIKTLLDNRENVSFPDVPEAFDRYFSDCLALKKQMYSLSEGLSGDETTFSAEDSRQAEFPAEESKQPGFSTADSKQSGFSAEDWLADCIRLLENLKTPYYGVYASVLFDLQACFPKQDLFNQTLKAFYSILIRSSEEALTLIQLIASHGRLCFSKRWLSGKLLSEFLIHQLSVYADGKNLWKPRMASLLHMEDHRSGRDLLVAWLGLQNQFLEKRTALDLTLKNESESLAGLLSSWEEWLRQPEYSLIDTGTAEKLICTSTDKGGGGNLSCTKADKVSGENLSWTNAGRETGDTHIWTGTGQNRQIDSEFLNTFAYNMNQRSYITNPAIGREQELKDLELILISPKKSPILIGESGVGKTSVVEGLAWLLQRGEVPPLLKDKVIFKLTTTSLLSGTKYVGEMEDRIKQLTGELAKYPNVILFIDEIHTIVGAGSTESSHNDISNMLKPFIDRGDIKIIGATTIQEYEAYILPDRALARRFYPIGIEEPDEDLTMEILLGTIPSMEEETQVKNTFSIEETTRLLRILVHLSDKENQPPGRITRLPELPLSLLEMAFSYAALNSRKELGIEDLILSVRHTNLLSKEVRMQAEKYFLI